jgi:hypothetical protein
MKRAFQCDGTASQVETISSGSNVTEGEKDNEGEEGESSGDEDEENEAETEHTLSNNERKSGRHNTENFAQYFTLLEEVSALYPSSDAADGITSDCFPGRARDGQAVADLDKTAMSREWIRFNPLDEPSERELVCEVEWKRVWRCVFVRTAVPYVAPLLSVDGL